MPPEEELDLKSKVVFGNARLDKAPHVVEALIRELARRAMSAFAALRFASYRAEVEAWLNAHPAPGTADPR